MILRDYKANFQYSGKFKLKKIEATEQDAPGALKNEVRGGESWKDGERGVYMVKDRDLVRIVSGGSTSPLPPTKSRDESTSMVEDFGWKVSIT
jgi:hypothetical protein